METFLCLSLSQFFTFLPVFQFELESLSQSLFEGTQSKASTSFMLSPLGRYQEIAIDGLERHTLCSFATSYLPLLRMLLL